MIIPEGYSQEQNCECGLNKNKFDPIPDSILGLSVKRACCIHDWMYGEAKNEKERQHADKVFLKNLLYLIDQDPSNQVTKLARRIVAYHYYAGVLLFGGAVYWNRRKQVSGRSDVAA